MRLFAGLALFKRIQCANGRVLRDSNRMNCKFELSFELVCTRISCDRGETSIVQSLKFNAWISCFQPSPISEI